MSASRTNWTGVAFGLTLSVFAAYQLFKLPPALPVLLETYGYDRTLAGGFMSIYALAGLVFSVYAGHLIERRGIGSPLLGALAIMAAGNLLAIVAPQLGLLVLAARGLEGIAFAVLAVAGPVLVNRAASERHLPLVVGMTAAWIPAGQILAALIAPFALPAFGWQSLWVLGLFGCALIASLVLRGARLGAAPNRGQAVESDGPRPPITHGQRRSLVLAGAIFMFWSGQYFAAMTWLPQYLVEVQDLDLAHAIAGYLLPVVVLLVFNLITGGLLRAGVPLGPLLTVTLVTQAICWWLMPAIDGAEAPLIAGLALLTAYGIGAGICTTCLFSMPSAILGGGKGSTAAAFGILMTGRNIGVLVGPVLVAIAFELTDSWSAAAPLIGGTTAVAVVIAALLSPRLRVQD